MSFAAAAGGALLVSPHGETVLAAGAVGELDAMNIVRRARHCGPRFRRGDACVYVLPVARGWLLLGISLFPIAPEIVIGRLERAARVLALALADRPAAEPGGGPAGGAPAAAFVPTDAGWKESGGTTSSPSSLYR